MKQVTGLTSTYSSDEFGICSALFELGGMVVMHDASGCNSTYTTHDEPRWYEMDSMIFISAISEMEAILGDDEKFMDDLVHTAENLHPTFIAVVGAPIPYMIGTDFQAIADMTSRRTGLPCMGFEANGMHHYTRGISMALEQIVRNFCTEEMTKTEEPSVNILGATPLDFSVNGSVESLRKWLAEAGFTVNSCFAMGSSLEELRRAGQAHVNLVVSYGGLAAAKLLQLRYGTPYVVGIPFGNSFGEVIRAALSDAIRTGISDTAYRNVLEQKSAAAEPGDDMHHRIILGEMVYASSLAAALRLESGEEVTILCPLDTAGELNSAKAIPVPEEDDIIRFLDEIRSDAGKAAHTTVIADPLYQPLCRGLSFRALPHEAFSGRIYDAVNPNLIGEHFYEENLIC